MKLIRLSSLEHKQNTKIRYRQKVGTMTEYYDNQGYLCYDEDEQTQYKPRKRGRPITKTKITKNKKRG